MENKINKHISEVLIFKILFCLCLTDMTLPQLFEQTTKHHMNFTISDIQVALNSLLEDGFIEIMDVQKITNENGESEIWKWHRVTKKGDALYDTLYDTLEERHTHMWD
ncbi:hypothetical protein RJI07_08685 [Mycoplasmatota bacterium WC30]